MSTTYIKPLPLNPFHLIVLQSLRNYAGLALEAEELLGLLAEETGAESLGTLSSLESTGASGLSSQLARLTATANRTARGAWRGIGGAKGLTVIPPAAALVAASEGAFSGEEGSVIDKFGDTWGSQKSLDTASNIYNRLHSSGEIVGGTYQRPQFRPAPVGSSGTGSIDRIDSTGAHRPNPNTAPTNKDMHSANGNINKMVGGKGQMRHPRKRRAGTTETSREAPKGQRRNKRRQAPPPRPKQHRAVAQRRAALPTEIKLERSVARQYQAFLASPNKLPPRLGDSGNTPTMLIHGYYVTSYAVPTINSILATEMMVFTSPTLFASSTTVNTAAVAPIYVCFSNGTTVAFNDTTNGRAYPLPFSNNTNLSTMVAYTVGIPSRYLGSSVSIDCRCPGTSSKPFMYAGNLPGQETGMINDRVTLAAQLQYKTPTALRSSPFSDEVPGMTCYSTYFPKDANALTFKTNYNTQTDLNDSSVPYVGCSGMVTGTTVNVMVSSWFEVQVSASNQMSMGLKKGPKVSSSDVFDELKSAHTTGEGLINVGQRTVSGRMAPLSQNNPTGATSTTDLLEQKLAELEAKYTNLSLRLDDDEKYISLDQDEPLSQSTIDLARTIKQYSLTGSKTTPKSFTS